MGKTGRLNPSNRVDLGSISRLSKSVRTYWKLQPNRIFSLICISTSRQNAPAPSPRQWIEAYAYQREIYERKIGLKKARPAGPSAKPAAAPNREAAEALALAALGFLAADPVRFDQFAALSGLRIDNLRQAAADPGFLAGVLDHLAGDEALLLSFAANRGLEPAEVVRAWTLLADPPEA